MFLGTLNSAAQAILTVTSRERYLVISVTIRLSNEAWQAWVVHPSFINREKIPMPNPFALS